MNKNMLKRCVMIIIILLITISFNTSYARGNQKLIERAQQLEKWEELTEEEREKQGATYNSVNLIDSVKRSTYNNLLGGNTPTLESKYSLMEKLPTGSINIGNQRNTQLCWAFSYTYVLDTTASMQNKKAYNFSSIHSDYVGSKYFNRRNGDVGNFEMALAISVSGAGPVYAKDMLFDDYYKETGTDTYEISYENVLDKKLVSRAKIKETYDFPSISKTYGETVKYVDNLGAEYSSEELNSVRTLIKQHIKNNGALFSSMYLSDDETEFNKLFSKSTDNNSIAYCNKKTDSKQNHAITIIGWDDNYSKENFANSEYKPLNDGAYIVINSYGEEVLPYFYISYEDLFIEQYIRGIKDIQVYSEEEKNYDNLYQYDELGQTFYYYDIEDGINLGKQIYTSNVFSREDKTKKEYITEVGIYVPITEGIEIYIDTENGDMKDYGDVVASYTGDKALEPGYHLIKLGNPIEVTGEKFAVMVKYINNDVNGGAAYPLECNINDSGLISSNTSLYSKAKAEVGQSFISSDGNNWSDINEYEFMFWSSKDEAYVTKTYKNTNACIKAFTTVEEPKILVESVNLNETSTTIKEGETKVLTATVMPENATNKTVNWTSEDSSIVEVNGGVIKGIKAGKTTVTVTTEDGGKTASCEVTVEKGTVEIKEVTGVNLDEASTTIKEGETKVLTATVIPEDATNKTVNWTSEDSSIAEVNGGVIKGKKAGKTIVTVTTEDGEKTASCEVTVEAKTIPVEAVNLDKASTTIKEGETKVLTATVMPENATNKKVNWSSADESVVTVENGVIEGKKAGKTTVTVTTEDGGKTASCEVTVEAKTIPVEAVNLDKASTTIKEGETKVLTATVMPENATNKKVNWSSTDESIVTVENGVIEGKKVGKTTVTVTTEDGGKTASCEVTVEEGTTETQKVIGVNLNKATTTVKEGETEVLIATVLPANATNKKVNWSSTDESIVTVENGVIEGKKAGKTIVTVTTEDGEKIATCEVTVEAKTIPVETVEIDKKSITIEIGKTEVLRATVLPENATNKKVNWSSEDEAIVTVTGGVIEGKKAGKTTVTVTTEDGEKIATCEVIVRESETENILLKTISLNTNKETIENGTILNLSVTFNPSNATNKNVKWESSNEKVATVNSNGVVKAVGEGKTTIKVISEDGNKEATCEIIVTKKVNNDDDIYSDQKDNTTSDRNLPNTGIKIIFILTLISLSLLAIIKFIKYRNLREIK